MIHQSWRDLSRVFRLCGLAVVVCLFGRVDLHGGDAGANERPRGGAEGRASGDEGAGSPDAGAPPPRVPARHATAALAMADFLLGQQTPEGAIPDCPGCRVVNEDSNMEYALIGVAAAYWYTREPRYLSALESGIRWLASREEMDDPAWKGSWMYAYGATAPYAPVPTSPGPGVSDVRGVDATSALFVYLIYLHKELSGSSTLATELRPNAQAAIEFLLRRNKAADDPFFLSSWQRKGDSWSLWNYEYAADQGDVYLGLEGWSRLYDGGQGPKHDLAAAIAGNLNLLFDKSAGRYGLGRDEGAGKLDLSSDGFDGIFPQGYLPWVTGRSASNLAALSWLRRGVRSDGSLSLYRGDPRYTLSAAILLMAAHSLGEPRPAIVADWLVTVPYDANVGGVRDTAKAGSPAYSNVAGFSIVGLLGFPALQ